jgi:hypothetical protein
MITKDYDKYNVIKTLEDKFNCELNDNYYKFNDDGMLTYLNLSKIQTDDVSIIYKLSHPNEFELTRNSNEIHSEHPLMFLDELIITVEQLNDLNILSNLIRLSKLILWSERQCYPDIFSVSEYSSFIRKLRNRLVEGITLTIYDVYSSRNIGKIWTDKLLLN